MLHIKNEILSKRHFHVINYATFSRNIDSKNYTKNEDLTD